MRRFFAVLLLCFTFPLAANAQSSVNEIQPTVMVFPFTANGNAIDREASARVAVVIATQMAATKTVRVLPSPPGTERKDYLTVSRAADADYYVTGFISPLGNGASLVEQVVSTASGIVLYSTTAQLQTYNDAAGQGDALANVIAHHANRNFAAIPPAPPVAASPTPPPAEGSQANLGQLFGRKKRPAAGAKPAPAAKPSTAAEPAAVKSVAVATAAPASAALGVVVLGTAPAALREDAAERLVRAFATTEPAKRVNLTAAQARGADAARCAADGVRGFAVATVDVRATTAFGARSAHVDLAFFDCAGNTRWHRAFESSARGASAAVDAAVENAAAAYLKR